MRARAELADLLEQAGHQPNPGERIAVDCIDLAVPTGNEPWAAQQRMGPGVVKVKRHGAFLMANNKDPNKKRSGEKPPGKFHFNPGNQSGKSVETGRDQNESDGPVEKKQHIRPERGR
jgi:hypothetical protein